MEARSSTQRNPAQPGSLQVVQFVSDEPQQQVDQNQNRTHHPDQKVTHRTPWLRRDEREKKEPDEDFPLLTFPLIIVVIFYLCGTQHLSCLARTKKCTNITVFKRKCTGVMLLMQHLNVMCTSTVLICHSHCRPFTKSLALPRLKLGSSLILFKLYFCY